MNVNCRAEQRTELSLGGLWLSSFAFLLVKSNCCELQPVHFACKQDMRWDAELDLLARGGCGTAATTIRLSWSSRDRTGLGVSQQEQKERQ